MAHLMISRLKAKTRAASALGKIASRFPQFLRRQLRRKKVTILLYHNIEKDLFIDHLAYLSKNYNFLKLKDLAYALRHGTWDLLPESALVITFDDGWKQNLELLDIVKRERVPVTIFLPTELIGTKQKIWNYLIDRKGADYVLNEWLKSISNAHRLQYMQQNLKSSIDKEFPNRDFLTWEEVSLMSSYIDFQSHGARHPVLTQCNKKELTLEVVSSKKMIENHLGVECYAFAYPYGKNNAITREMVRSAGYQVGRTCNLPFLASRSVDPYNLPAIGVSDDCDVPSLVEKIAWAEMRSIFN